MNLETKGHYAGKCNLTRCDHPTSPAIYYNYSTRKYYCVHCAHRLNTDPYNKRDALRLFGHDLCLPHTAEEAKDIFTG